MTTRDPDLDLDLAGAAHPSRAARKEMRRFVARRAIALVEDAGEAVSDVARTVARRPGSSIRLRAWFDGDTGQLRVEVTDIGNLAPIGIVDMPVVAALTTSCGTGDLDGAPGAWFEMESTDVHARRGRVG